MSDEEYIVLDFPCEPLRDAEVLLSSAVYKLAVGPEKLKPRLIRAYLELTHIDEDALPEPLAEDIKWIKDQLTSRKDPNVGRYAAIETPEGTKRLPLWVGHLQYTLGPMRYARAQRIAERICSVHARAVDLLE